MIFANGATAIEAMMGFGWGNVRIKMVCCVLDFLGLIPANYSGHVVHSLFWPSFSLIQMCLLRLAVLGIFSLHEIGRVGFRRFMASLIWLNMGMLRLGCSGHLFPSWGRACCVSAIWVSFPVIEIGHVAFGHFGAFVLSWKWASCIFCCFGLLVRSLKWSIRWYLNLLFFRGPMGFNMLENRERANIGAEIITELVHFAPEVCIRNGDW